MRTGFIILLCYLLTILSTSGCDNLFAPGIDTTSSSSILTDQTTIEGFFKNFEYSYTFKDTTVYGELLAPDFIFTYRDYENGFDVSWDRQTDMRTTNGLFQNSQRLEVVWNNIIFQQGDSLNFSVKRSFNLTITFNPSDIVIVNGFADMSLKRAAATDKWKLFKWRDESF